MTEVRDRLQTVAGVHGLILAWDTDDGVLQARYDYAVPANQAPASDGIASLRACIVSDADADALLELSAFSGIEATLNGEIVVPMSGRLEPFGNAWPIRLRAGDNDLQLRVELAQVNPRVSARLCAPDRSELGCVVRLSPPWQATVEDLRSGIPDDHRLSPWHCYNDLACAEPAMRLRNESRSAWLRWREDFGARLRELMGPTDPPPPTDLVTLSSEDLGPYRRDRVLLRGDGRTSIPAWLLVPHQSNGGGIVSIHGHGYVHGESVGVHGDDPAARESIERHSYAYGARYAELGYVVVNPDLRNFGARLDDEQRRRDPCDLNAFRLQQFGINLVARQVSDLRACLDLLAAHDAVDPDRIGATGLSYGGRLTMYLAALDERIRCAVASGCLNVFRERLCIDSSCGAQFVFGLLSAGDTPEVFGLIAPRPLLLELGTRDGTSPEIFAMDAYSQIQCVYRAAGVPERLDIDIFESGHKYSGAKAFDWFERWLLQS